MLYETLSQLQKQVLVGILLGDGCLHANTHKNKYSLKILQSDKHKDYVFHLYDIFKNFTLTPPRNCVFQDKKFPGKTYSRWYFNTVSHPAFRFYAHQFYSENKKVVPKLIHKWLTPRSIAYWYMDDGAQKWKHKSLGVRFSTDKYSLKEVTQLVHILQKDYNLKCSIQKKDRKPRIYVSSFSHDILKNHIFKFLVPSMYYKFPTTLLKQCNK